MDTSKTNSFDVGKTIFKPRNFKIIDLLLFELFLSSQIVFSFIFIFLNVFVDFVFPTFVSIAFYDSGRIHTRYTKNDKDEIHGTYKEFYDDEKSTLKHIVFYLNGVMHGLEELYYEDGSLFQKRTSQYGL